MRFLTFLFLLICAACQETAYNSKDIESCNSQCNGDADCTVLTGNCFLTAANKDDTQCFWEEHKKFTSTIGRNIKCAPTPASDYRAVCVKNQCRAEDLNPVTLKSKLIKDPLVPPRVKPNLPTFYQDTKWQFADYIAPAIETLGPDYKVGDKPFIAFDGRGNMWGQDGTIWFHRTYEFDEYSINFAPHPDKLCNPDRCFDRLKDKPKPDNEMEQTRFLGRYDFRFTEGSLAFENASETVELKPFVPEGSLPPLPKDLPLCEIRDMKSGESFPDYRPAVFDDIGYRVIGSDQTLYWDHHVGPQGYVELGDGQEVLFDGPDGPKILRRLTPYNTTASFGPQGLYCVSGGYDRHWPRFMTAEQFEIPDLSSSDVDIHATTLVIGNHCLQIEDITGNRYSPIFSKNSDVGYDDFGFYYKREGRSYRIGDEMNLDLQFTEIAKEAFKGFPRNACLEPLMLIEE